MQDNTSVAERDISRERPDEVESENLVEVKDLRVHYVVDDGVVEAVNGVSFSIKKGETFGLIGETGAGKTTIALSILRLLPTLRSRVIHGEILFDGENLLEKNEKQMHKILGKKISMIFQDPMTALNPVHRIGEQIAEVIKIHNPDMPKGEIEIEATKMLNLVGIQSDRYKDYPFQLSGGMKQRVVIAMALACQPDLIIADEPTTALDVTIQAQVLELMKDLKNRFNTSVLLITHDFGVVADICDKCAVLYAGEIVECGTLQDVFGDPRHPYTIGLFNSLPSLSEEVESLKPIPGLMSDPMNLPTYCTFADRCDRCVKSCREGDPVLREVSPGHLVKCFNVEQ